MPLRVLFVTTTYPLKKGDAIPGFVADLASHLVRDQRIEVTVLAPHHPGAAFKENVDGVRIERFQYTRAPARQCLAYGNGIPDNVRNSRRALFQIPGFLIAMCRAVVRHLPTTDIIHAHWIEPAFVAELANIRCRKPLVVSVHSLKPKRSALHAKTLSAADRVLFNSRFTLSEAQRKGYRFRGEVIYQGYDDSLFGRLPNTGVMREKMGIPIDAQLVTAVGRMIEVKGLHMLAAASNAILAQRPRVHIVIAGDGPEKAGIEKILACSAHRDRVHLPGAMPRARVAQLLAESDLFVNPGIVDRRGRAEGLGITTIEAMASELAVVGSSVGGIVETIVDGVTGILVPSGDVRGLSQAVGRLLDDVEICRRMGSAGREKARTEFAWPALAEKVASIYRSL